MHMGSTVPWIIFISAQWIPNWRVGRPWIVFIVINWLNFIDFFFSVYMFKIVLLWGKYYKLFIENSNFKPLTKYRSSTWFNWGVFFMHYFVIRKLYYFNENLPVVEKLNPRFTRETFLPVVPPILPHFLLPAEDPCD